MSKRKPTQKPTTIAVYPGIDVVVQPGASAVIVNALRDMLLDQREAFAQERVADLLGGDDRYTIAELLQREPERLEQIAKVIREWRVAS